MFMTVVLIATLSASTGRCEEQTTDILWTQQKQHSLGNEDLIIRDFFQDKRDGFFVDIGCAWPIKNSNTYYLENDLGWTGIGVDALSEYAEGWAKLRPRSKFLNFLVTAESDKPEKFYKVVGPGMSTAEKGVADHLKVVGELEVRGITLDDLLERNGVKEIDLLSIDVEGHQKSVLAGFDLQRWKPKLVCVEDDGLFSVPWFKERGYEPIERYRLRDIANWYFAPKELAQAANARETERGREEARKRAALMASAPEDSLIRSYAPQYVLGSDGLPKPNPARRKVEINPEAAAQAEPSPKVSDRPPAP
jgi:FkbM family methyltransferase